MGIRPGRAVRGLNRAWTRTAKKVAKKAFVRGVPDSKIHVFMTGTISKMKEYDVLGEIHIGFACQVRDNALEAARVMANKYLEKTVLSENYFFKVLVYPHQCLREHSILMGAGADRLSKGMQMAFGKPTGRAAVTRKGQVIMRLWSFKRFKDQVKGALERASRKLPGNTYVTVTELK